VKGQPPPNRPFQSGQLPTVISHPGKIVEEEVMVASRNHRSFVCSNHLLKGDECLVQCLHF